MSGPDLFAALILSASVMAPALPPQRPAEWVGQTVFVKQSGGMYEKRDPDGSFTPAGRLKSIQYVVVRDDEDRLQLTQDGKPIWVKKEEMVRQKDAVEYYTKRLDAEPDNDQWFAFRGWVRHRTGNTAEGLKDYAEAIRLNPTAASWYGNRGLIHLEAKKVDDAIADFTSAIDLSPTNEVCYRNRALAYSRKKDWARAAADYEKVVELDPESAVALNGLAWLLCTASDDKVRDGKRAVELAKKACDLTEHKTGGYLDTLAAAYAEVGEFAKAVEWQEKALKAGDLPVKDVDGARQRLELYKAKKPYRGE
jgi:tetratricopeptide (TPR) repeat protein